jgi:hypothetical protein
MISSPDRVHRCVEPIRLLPALWGSALHPVSPITMSLWLLWPLLTAAQSHLAFPLDALPIVP